MSSRSTSTAKSCVLCGEDCSSRPRVRDARGRYYCRECHDRAAARREAQPVVACPNCGLRLEAGSALCVSCGYHLDSGRVLEARIGASEAELDRLLAHDVFLLRQKVFTIGEDYVVRGEHEEPLLHVKRPFSSTLALTQLAIIAPLFLAGWLLLQVKGLPAVALIALAGVFVAMEFIVPAILPKRHVSFFVDPERTRLALTVRQDNWFQLTHRRFTVLDAGGEVVGRIVKNRLTNLIRRCWKCYGPDGEIVCLAKEDSFFKAQLRGLYGSAYGLLRRNFVLMEPCGGRHIGKCDRKFSIRDHYVLDLRCDPGQSFDRRLAVAIAVLLDTGEAR